MTQFFRNRLRVIFLAILLLLYVAILSLDFLFLPGHQWLDELKFTSILVCFLFAVMLYWTSTNQKDSKFVVMGLFFTVIADVNLVLMNAHVLGVFFFCLVQLTYLKRFTLRYFWFSLIVAAIAMSSAFFLFSQTLYVLAGLYAFLILSVTTATWRSKLSPFNKRCASWGMILFILCDLHVALANQLPANYWYDGLAHNLVWLFYLPSQTLLAMSGQHS